MIQGRILHLCGWDKKFILSFRDLIHAHFADGRHKFIVYGPVDQAALPPSADTVVYRSLLREIFALSKAMQQAQQIILHGLFSSHLLYILALQPWLLKKCCWVIWGGDLYIHQNRLKDWRAKKNDFFRKIVVKNLGKITTTVPGDYLLARNWYNTRATYVQNLMYYSHVSRMPASKISKKNSKLIIQIGNSADPSNNHKEIIDKLSISNREDLIVCAPLSYGVEDYRNEIIEYGLKKLGAKFIPLTEFMTFGEYNEYLATVDIAIFNHARQQGMGNTIALLSLGAKVYIRSDVTPWHFFNEIGLCIFDAKELIGLTTMSTIEKNRNIEICLKSFSEQALIEAWDRVFSNTQA